jgi:acetolactate synthase-1/3 small subunit
MAKIGEEKRLRRHIIGMLVEDAPGVMAKISGLFARRGFNMDTIVVGKTAQEGVSHIVVSLLADDRTIEQVEKQVNKLIDVIKVIDLSPGHSVVREHCLVKIASTARSRADIVNLAKLHKAKALSVNHESIIVEIVGSPQKIDSFIELVKKYGIREFSRTGINAMQRGKA